MGKDSFCINKSLKRNKNKQEKINNCKKHHFFHILGKLTDKNKRREDKDLKDAGQKDDKMKLTLSNM